MIPDKLANIKARLAIRAYTAAGPQVPLSADLYWWACVTMEDVEWLIAEVERLQGEAKRALEVIAGQPADQLQYLHDRGLQGPRVGWHSKAASQHPEAFWLEGTHEWDALYNYPARERLVAAVVAAALMELAETSRTKEQGEKT